MLSPSGTSVLRAGAAYFAWVFGVGFLLGCIRVPLVVPRLGERMAELLEAPVMLVVIFLASRHVVHRFGVSARASIPVGLLALVFLVIAELVLAAVMDRSITDRDPVTGTVYLAALLLYATLPWLHARTRVIQS